MAKLTKFSPLVIAVFALVGFLVYLNLPEPQQEKKSASSQTPVAVAEAKIEAFALTVEALGTAVANESVSITAQQTQTVTGLLFEDGDLVKRGQLLVQLNNRAEIARLNEIDVSLAEARRQLKRIEGLVREKAASEQLLSEQEASVQVLLAQKEVAEAALEDLKISAPFNGKLGTRLVSVGSLVRPGDTITTLDDLSVIKLDFSISEMHLASVQRGQKVFATTVAYPDTTFTGTITNVDSRIDPVTRSIRVRAQIPNEMFALRPGLLMQISLEKRVLNTLVVPESALVPEGDEQFLFVVNGDNKATKRAVTIGERRPGLVEVTAGLTEGEKVIVEGTLRVRDGSSVRIVS